MSDKNYITPTGLARLREEYRQLKYEERPKIVEVVHWAAGNGDRSENGDYIYGKKRLREIDRRLRFLSKRVDIAEVVDPAEVQSDRVLFGATVTIETEEGETKTWAIVGADESNPEQGRISWTSPIARALFKSRVGDFVTYRIPAGEKEIEVLKIEYKSIEY